MKKIKSFFSYLLDIWGKYRVLILFSIIVMISYVMGIIREDLSDVPTDFDELILNPYCLYTFLVTVASFFFYNLVFHICENLFNKLSERLKNGND